MSGLGDDIPAYRTVRVSALDAPVAELAANLLRVRQFTGNRVVNSDNPLLPAQAVA